MTTLNLDILSRAVDCFIQSDVNKVVRGMEVIIEVLCSKKEYLPKDFKITSSYCFGGMGSPEGETRRNI